VVDNLFKYYHFKQ